MPGMLPGEAASALLTVLPLDVTFIDADDIIRFYSDYRIFKRTPDILGTSVQSCHPPASRRQVTELIDDLKSGRKPVSEFKAEKKGRSVNIRYSAVRSIAGEYVGLLEVAMWADKNL